jgi:hypothetical protein
VLWTSSGYPLCVESSAFELAPAFRAMGGGSMEPLCCRSSSEAGSTLRPDAARINAPAREKRQLRSRFEA